MPTLPNLAAALLTTRPVPVGAMIDCGTDVGDLYLHADDRVMTPYIVEAGRWEEDEAAWLRSVLRPGQTVLDCGANVGYFSVLASRAVGPLGKVVAVEPEPRNLALLRLNLWRNGCDNVTVLAAAASDARGTLALRNNELNRGDHQTRAEPQIGDQVVPAVALDDVFRGGQLDVAKVDTQGSDYLVLRGLATTLVANPEAEVLVEFWLDSMIERDISADDVLDGFRGLAREVCVLGSGGQTSPASNAEVKAAAMSSPPDHWVNLVLRPPA